jgi:two-component system, response regulator RegA
MSPGSWGFLRPLARIPLTSAGERLCPSMVSGSRVRDVGHSHVLVVDASEPWRRWLVRGLRGFVAGAEAVASGGEALRQLSSARFDAAVPDLQLPDTTGLDLIPVLRQRCPRMVVLVVTGHGSVASTVRALKLGAADYLLKPIAPERIAAALAGEPVQPRTPWLEEMSLDRVAWEHIHRVLDETHGNISEAARRLRIHRQSLQRKLRKPPPLSRPLRGAAHEGEPLFRVADRGASRSG